jgi:hypothetical protein
MKIDATEYVEEERAKIAPGECTFLVKGLAEGVSKSSGNPMITLELELEDKNHIIQGKVFDYLPVSKNMIWKIKTFMLSVGLDFKKEVLQLNEINCCGKSGQCTVEFNEDGYVRIKKYLPRESVDSPAQNDVQPKVEVKKEITNDFDDDIPF